MTVLLDPSVVVAASDRADLNHASAVAWFAATTEPLVISAAALAECDHVLSRALGPAAAGAFVAALTSGAIDIVGPSRADIARAQELRAAAVEARISLADALTVALVERLGVPRVATFDRRPYSILRSIAGVTFDLVP